MNIEQILCEVEAAIYNRPCHANANCNLGFEGDNLLCLPKLHNHPKFTPIVKVTSEEMNHGFTSRRWAQIGSTLYRFYKEIDKCPHPPKP